MSDPLLPNRFSNLKFSLLNVSSLVLDYLLQEGRASQQQLLKHLNNFSTDFCPDDVLRAVTFLYAVNKVTYRENFDLIEITRSHAQTEPASA